jgi:hypothetical protein
MKEAWKLRVKIERARRRMYKASQTGNVASILAASRVVDKLLNQYEQLQKEAGIRVVGH